jgi:hypothetical protein
MVSPDLKLHNVPPRIWLLSGALTEGKSRLNEAFTAMGHSLGCLIK